MSHSSLDRLIERAEVLIDRLEAILPKPLSNPDWNASIAFRYRKRSHQQGHLEPVRHISDISLQDLKEINGQKEKIERNTEQFVTGQTANNVLLTGARGTGNLLSSKPASTPMRIVAYGWSKSIKTI